MTVLNTSQIVKRLVESNQDFEWYPTTTEILGVIRSDMDKLFDKDDDRPSVLDCGAGDGRALRALTDGHKYAIEKSPILLNLLGHDIFVLGTNLMESSLIDKKVSALFSNPPYLFYKEWALKIIDEANALYIYLVLPTRWKEQDVILAAIKERGGKHFVIGNFDFYEAERQARCTVDIVKIDLCSKYSRCRHKEVVTNPFDVWFERFFGQGKTDNTDKTDSSEDKISEKAHEQVKNQVGSGADYITTLVGFYDRQMDDLLATYKKLSDIAPILLQELKCSINDIRGSLELKIKSLKDCYWDELYKNFSMLTSRLISDTRKTMLKTLSGQRCIDLTVSNCHAVMLWTAKNVNEYLDQQIVTIFERLTEKANVIKYKSNQNTWRDQDWYYCRRPENLHRYKLDYRIVLEHQRGIITESWRSGCDHGLHESATDIVDDLCTIAMSLGFDTYELPRARNFKWERGQEYTFVYRDITTKTTITLFKVRAFLNGNLHFKLNQAFVRRLNVAAGRLLGWLHTPQEAADELNINVTEATEDFQSLCKVDTSNVLQLVAGSSQSIIQ